MLHPTNLARCAAARRWLLCWTLLSGCDGVSSDPERAESALDASTAAPSETASSAGAASEGKPATVPAERAALCARPADDVVRDLFCKGERTSVSSLRELLIRLQIPALPVDMDEEAAAQIKVESPTKPVDHLVLLGHSTALSGQLISPLNPRAILIGPSVLVAFQRGVQKVEMAATDRLSGRRNFYLLSFTQTCNERPEGCRPGDLYTLALEQNWLSVVLHDDEDLKNTVLDCRQCHQRNLPKPLLLMRELQGPWQHFFLFEGDETSYAQGKTALGQELIRDFLAAKGTESYAGMPTDQLRHTAGVTLQKAVPQQQPLVFDPSVTLQLEGKSRAGEPRRSGVWDNAYAAFKRGEHLALPYFEQRIADAAKQAALTEAYGRYRRGELAREELPDLSDIFPDDPQTRAEIGLQTEPDATPAEALVQACGACHNDVLDQTITRARFNIALSRMSREELDIAIARIELPSNDERAMPPKGMRQLDERTRPKLIQYLREGARSAEDDALLTSAAKAGMALGGYAY